MFDIQLLPAATKLQQGNIFTGICQSFCSYGGGVGVNGRGGHAWQGAIHGKGGGHVWWEGHAWQGGVHGRGVCMAGGMHGRGMCMAGGMCGRAPQQILRNTVNERAIRILLECILV